MKVTLRSDHAPDVLIEANDACGLRALDQHIRTLHAARDWLAHELELRKTKEIGDAQQAVSQAGIAAAATRDVRRS